MAVIIEELVENILGTRYEAFSRQDVKSAKNRVIDVIGCLIAEANAPGCFSRYLTGSLIIITNHDMAFMSQPVEECCSKTLISKNLSPALKLLEMNGESYRFKDSMRRRELVA